MPKNLWFFEHRSFLPEEKGCIMPNFKFVISHAAKSYQVEKDQKDCPVLEKKIGDTFSGDFLGLDGYDFPMRLDIESIGRKDIVITKGIGFKAKRSGLRKRKLIRGNTISLNISQINCKVVKQGEKPIEEVLGKKETAEQKEQ